MPSSPWPPPLLSALLETLATRDPGPRLTDETESLDFAGLLQRVRRLAGGLAGIGVRPGDHVAIWMRNRLEWLEAWFAVAWMGGTLVPLNTRFTAGETKFVLVQSRTRWLICTPGDGALTPALIDDLRGRPAATLRGVVVLDAPPAAGQAAFATLRAADPVASREVESGVGMIQYTSGSTAFPKGAMLGNAGLIRNGFGLGQAWRLVPEDRVLCANPLFHCGGSVFAFLASVTHGASICLRRRWDPSEAARLIRQEGLTVFPGIDAMVRDLVAAAQAGADVGHSLRLVSTAASRQLFEAVVARLGADVSNVYGLTECSPNVCVGDLRDPLERRLERVGRPQPGLEVEIRDPASRQRCGPGEVGEIVVRGWAVMRGYFDNPEATRSAFDADGFLRTGDLGSLDAAGYLGFDGRLKLMLKSGGENVPIAEVEEALRSHPAVADVAVVPVPHPRYGEVGFAFVRGHPDRQLSAEAVLAHCRGRLAGFKIPKYVEVVADLPRTGSGKVDRQDLQRRAAEQVAAAEGERV